MSKNPWICALCRSIVSTRFVPAALRTLATRFAEIGAPDVLVDLKRDFRIGKPPESGLPGGHAEECGDLARQLLVRAAREHLQLSEPGCHERVTHQLQP